MTFAVVSTAEAALTLYKDPIVAANTAQSDFRIADLMNADHPVSLYLVVPSSDLDRSGRLIRLTRNQTGKRLTEGMDVQRQRNGYRHRLLMTLGDFLSLGRLSFYLLADHPESGRRKHRESHTDDSGCPPHYRPTSRFEPTTITRTVGEL